MKTLTEFKDSPFYRFLKVLYFLTLIPLAFIIYYAIDDSSYEAFVFVAFAFVFMEIVKRIIFYIAIGSKK